MAKDQRDDQIEASIRERFRYCDRRHPAVMALMALAIARCRADARHER